MATTYNHFFSLKDVERLVQCRVDGFLLTGVKKIPWANARLKNRARLGAEEWDFTFKAVEGLARADWWHGSTDRQLFRSAGRFLRHFPLPAADSSSLACSTAKKSPNPPAVIANTTWAFEPRHNGRKTTNTRRHSRPSLRSLRFPPAMM